MAVILSVIFNYVCVCVCGSDHGYSTMFKQEALVPLIVSHCLSPTSLPTANPVLLSQIWIRGILKPCGSL